MCLFFLNLNYTALESQFPLHKYDITWIHLMSSLLSTNIFELPQEVSKVSLHTLPEKSLDKVLVPSKYSFLQLSARHSLGVLLLHCSLFF